MEAPRIDEARLRLVYAGRSCELTQPLLLALARALAEHFEEYIHRERLITLAWHGRSMADSTVRAGVARLRRLLVDADIPLDIKAACDCWAMVPANATQMQRPCNVDATLMV